MNTSDPAAYAALHQQLAKLEAISVRVTECRRRLPQSSDGVWRGVAQSAYANALHGLGSELTAAAGRLDGAVERARSALHGMLAHA